MKSTFTDNFQFIFSSNVFQFSPKCTKGALYCDFSNVEDWNHITKIKFQSAYTFFSKGEEDKLFNYTLPISRFAIKGASENGFISYEVPSAKDNFLLEIIFMIYHFIVFVIEQVHFFMYKILKKGDFIKYNVTPPAISSDLENNLKTYVFSDGSILTVENHAKERKTIFKDKLGVILRQTETILDDRGRNLKFSEFNEKFKVIKEVYFEYKNCTYIENVKVLTYGREVFYKLIVEYSNSSFYLDSKNWTSIVMYQNNNLKHIITRK